MAYDTPQNTASPGGIALGTRVEMFPSLPLAEYDAAGGPAFAARLKGEGANDLIAILCTMGLPTRLDSVTSLRSVDHPSILRLIDSGIVLWPSDDTRYCAFAYQRPLSPRFMTSLDATHAPINEDNINQHFVTPLIGGLLELQRVGLVHNAIRPTNMFWRIGSSAPPQLGDCLSAPAGFGQPAMFETLERAMSSDPTGRGVGSHSDDCYAFGVSLALLILGHNPLQGMDDAAILQAKSERGSFAALTANRRLPASQIELLRGLLTDDSRQRWTATELEQWHTGRRMTPKSTDTGRRSSRHFEFAGGQYWQLRPLAGALAANVHEAVRVIENGAVDKWLRRALGDDDHANAMADAVASLKESGKSANYEEQLVARACIALDPAAPIRYRGISVMPNGIAGMVAEAVLTGKNVQVLSEIISSQLVTLWVEMQRDVKTELVPLAQQFERMKNFIEKGNLGNGFERVAYELNPGLNCLSPMLRAHYVTTPKALLPALERVAASSNRSRDPMDRHIASFLIVRDRRSETLFDNMGGADNSPRKGLALLNLYADMQQRHGPDALPNLAQWLLPQLEISVRRYLSKALREKLIKQMKEVAQRGNLGALLQLVDDPRRVEGDAQQFMAARMLYFNILKEATVIENRMANRDAVIQGTGKPMAASLSSFLAILLGLAAILRAVWQSLS